MEFIELNHVIRDGLISYPGMPPVEISALYTREQCGQTFGGESAALLDFIKMVNISGTYIDAPYHRYEDGYKICDIPLEKCFALPVFTVDLGTDTDEHGNPVFTAARVRRALEGKPLRGAAVLLRSGHDKKFMTPEYARCVPYCALAAAEWFVEQGIYVLGIDTQLEGSSAWVIGKYHAIKQLTDIRRVDRFGFGGLRQGYRFDAGIYNSTAR